MKRQPDPFGRPAAGQPGVVSGWLFSDAFPGAAIGLVRAFSLWVTLRFILFFVPDVGWGIWFLRQDSSDSPRVRSARARFTQAELTPTRHLQAERGLMWGLLYE